MNPYGPKIMGKVDWKKSSDNNTPTTVENINTITSQTGDAPKSSSLTGSDHTTPLPFVLSLTAILIVAWGVCRLCMGSKSRSPSASDRSMRDLMDRI